MKAVGIVRRIDELGRIVIPKEIRRALRIQDGQGMEIFYENNQIILRKYSPLSGIADVAEDYVEAIANATGFACCICDSDTVIAMAYGSLQPYEGRNNLRQKTLSREMDDAIRECAILHYTKGEVIPIVTGDSSQGYVEQVIIPIKSDDGILGTLILFNKSEQVEIGTSDIDAAQIITSVIGRQAEA